MVDTGIPDVEDALTRVEVCEGGLRVVARLRWEDVRQLELVRINGRPTARSVSAYAILLAALAVVAVGAAVLVEVGAWLVWPWLHS